MPSAVGSIELQVLHHHRTPHHCATDVPDPSLLLGIRLCNEVEIPATIVAGTNLETKRVLLADLLFARLDRAALLQPDHFGRVAIIAKGLEAAEEVSCQDEAALAPLSHVAGLPC